MPLDIIIGAQWGDEGKGHITDSLAAQANIVARYSGGDNAGHTITVGSDIFKLHLIPSGIIHKDTTCLIGGGVVLNPAVMLREMSALAARGVDVSPERLKLSGSAHLITPAHIALDKAAEAKRGETAIGTTQRGIGPAYTDKTARTGLRAELLANPEELADAIQQHITEKNRVLQEIYGQEPLNATAVAASFSQFAQQLKPYLVDGPTFLHEALADGRNVLAEGAQGTFLDLDNGTYPYVTSSHPTTGGVLTGLGVGPNVIRRVIGIAKAFSSRVGSGPFPSELDGEMAMRLRGTGANPWDEYGTTTGRPRRVGWLDLVMLRHAVRLNGFYELVLTKLDILSGLDTLQLCVAYELDGRTLKHFPANPADLARCRPVYHQVPGWHEDLTAVRHHADLPLNARRYIDLIAEFCGAPVTYVSVGPGREQIVKY